MDLVILPTSFLHADTEVAQLSYICVYATVEEIAEVVSELAEWRRLTGCVQVINGVATFDAIHAVEHKEALRVGFNLFLFPGTYDSGKSMSEDKVQSRKLGWVQVRLGGILQYKDNLVLEATKFYGNRPDVGEIRGDLYVAGMQTRLKKRLHNGVRAAGAGKVFGEVCSSVLYTDQAIECLERGVPWKESREGKYHFIPATMTSDPLSSPIVKVGTDED